MSNIAKPNTFSSNTSISSSQVNANFDTIYNDYNGNVSEANLADSAVTTDKIASSAVTAAKVADDAVTAAKIDWASTGANAGIWWEELGRTTLGSAGDTITVSSIPARKYLKILVNVIDSGSINVTLTLNNDTSTNYARRISVNGAADVTTTSASNVTITNGSAGPHMVSIDLTNNSTEFKLGFFAAVSENAGGAATAPERLEGGLKWASTSQVTRVDIVNTSTGDYAIGSEVVVLGHN